MAATVLAEPSMLVKPTESRSWIARGKASDGELPRAIGRVGRMLRIFWKLQRLKGGESQFSSVMRLSAGGGNPAMMPRSAALVFTPVMTPPLQEPGATLGQSRASG